MGERILNHADTEQIATTLEQAASIPVGTNDLLASKFPSHNDGSRIMTALSTLKTNGAFNAEYRFATVAEMNAAIQAGTVPNNATIYVAEGSGGEGVMSGATSSAAGTSGLTPQPVAGDNEKFLRGDATWQSIPLPLDMVGASSLSGGTHGLVPAPAAGDNEKFLRGDGIWAEASGGTTIVKKPTVVVGTYTYNGSAQGPTITWDTGMADNCIITNGTKTDAGTYTMTIALKNTAKMYWNDLTTADLTYEYSISKANQTLVLSSNSVTLDTDHLTATVTVTGAQTTLSATTSDNTVATASVSGSTVTISNVNETNGSATITITAESTNNYNSATASVSVTAQFTTFLDEWLTAGGLNPALYADLDAVFADEAAVRRLFTIHDAVDYLVTNASDSNVATIINNDYCAKWINLRDYALDTLYADTTIAALMDTADKYFYGEWVITDSTTTPPTWGAKGNVPMMTSNTAPYGKAVADSVYDSSKAEYKAFDGDFTSYWTSANSSFPHWIGYHFKKPVCVKCMSIIPEFDGNYSRVKDYKIQGSNDNETWVDLYSGTYTYSSNYEENKATIINSNFYLYYRLYIVNRYGSSNNYGGARTLQFYGRELKVSVPTMTSNTAPYGTAIGNGTTITNGEYFKAFDDTPTGVSGKETGFTSPTGKAVGYKFISKVLIKQVSTVTYIGSATATLQLKIQGSNNTTTGSDGTWTDIASKSITKTSSTEGSRIDTFDLSNNTTEYQSYRMLLVSTTSNNTWFTPNLQFYGLDYSEYDWDVDNPRHYIYDHGVELENYTDQVSPRGSGYAIKNVEKLNSEMYFESNSGGSPLYICSYISSNTVNGSLYDRLRFKLFQVPGYGAGIYVGTVQTTLVDTATAYISQAFTEDSLDISNVNDNVYIAVVALNGRIFTLTELWLE